MNQSEARFCPIARTVASFNSRRKRENEPKLMILLWLILSVLFCVIAENIIFQTQIKDENQNDIGVLQIKSGQEVADAVYEFGTRFNLTQDKRSNLWYSICTQYSQQLPCSRRMAMVYKNRVYLPDGSFAGVVGVFEGQEPADAVDAIARNKGWTKETRDILVDKICQEVKCTRTLPVVFSAPVKAVNGTNLGVLQVEEGEETVDAIYRFRKETGLWKNESLILLQNVCNLGRTICTRGRALLYQRPISDVQEGVVGTLEIYEDDEPADAIYHFAQSHGLDRGTWKHLIDHICNSDDNKYLVCNRMSPIIFSIPIANENGTYIDHLHIEDGQEPIDALSPFCKKHDFKENQKKHILKAVCKSTGLPCTRDRALLFSTPIKTSTGDTYGMLHIHEDEEPIDAISEFSENVHALTFDERKAVLINTCMNSNDKFNCTRAEAKLFSVPVMESADKEVGKLEIFEGQEPADIVYSFLEKHDLFQTPANTSLLEAACNSSRLVCNRKKPRQTLFTMQANWYGVPHELRYVQPESDWHCYDHFGGQKCVHYAEILAEEFCSRHMAAWDQCHEKILEALRTQLDLYEDRVWKGKNLYAKLGLVRTATNQEIDAAYNTLVLRINNETEPQKYTKLQDAYRILSDAEEKYFYDLPCQKIFGLCAKKQKDGGLQILAD